MSYNIRVPKRWTRLAAIVGVLALIAAPMTALATHSFDDVPNSHTFHGDIAWMKASGVTKGCNPPANSLYCPEDDVTRGQMSAFMRRFAQYLGAEDGTPAQADNASTADSATTAGDADTLDGKDGTAYETRVAADGCRLNVAASATSCGPNSNGTLPNGSTFEFAAATVNGPSSGTLVVSAHTWSSVIHWLTLDQSCDSGALFAQALNGLIWIEDTVSQFS
ncbi:MAG TPA: S-layer homology domain-containing protein, partial [Acidimicrobiia bacterium]